MEKLNNQENNKLFINNSLKKKDKTNKFEKLMGFSNSKDKR